MSAKKAAPAKKTVAAKKAAPAKKAAVKTAKSAAPAKVPTGAGQAVPAEAAVPAWQVAGYLHEQELGDGPSGRVVRARHEASGTPVAITYLVPELAADAAFRAAFRDEAPVLGALESPYVVRLYAYVEDGPHAAVVNEPAAGARLDALLRENGAISPEAALTVLKGSLLGLAAAHEAGVVHGAFEPANVLVGTDGAAGVGGFGLAVRGKAGGTSPYAALERSAGGPATAASDVYAAAAVLHESLTGPAPARNGQVPEPVRPLLVRGLAAEPAERPQTAAEFATELDAVASAAYGEDWEDRGRRELAALVALLIAPPVKPPVEPAAAAAVPPPAPPVFEPGSGSEPGGRQPRFGRRAKILAVVAAAVIVAGAVTVTAVATGDKDETPTAVATPTATASATLTSAPTPAVTTDAPSASPSASPTTKAPTTAAAPPPTVRTQSPTATSKSTPSPSATAVPSTPSASPTKTTGTTSGPKVSSVSVTGLTCSPGSGTATATVLVRYDGTAAGTLKVVWWRSATGGPQGAITLPAQTTRFPKAAQSFTFTDKLTFTPDPKHPYVGLTVSTDPAAASGNNSYRVGCR